MKICFPVESDNGLESEIFGHFGSAPFFVIHDTESGTTNVLNNGNQHHAHGACQPLAALGGQSVDAVIVGGIGAGAISKLNAAGIHVYQSGVGTIEDNVQALKEGSLAELMVEAGCKGHSGCDH